MAMSSVSVVLSSLALNLYKSPKDAYVGVGTADDDVQKLPNWSLDDHV
jgi:hypothetical protein